MKKFKPLFETAEDKLVNLKPAYVLDGLPLRGGWYLEDN